MDKLIKPLQDSIINLIDLTEEDIFIRIALEINILTNNSLILSEDELVKMGQKIYIQWEKLIYSLICTSNFISISDQKILEISFNSNKFNTASIISALLVLNLGISPTIANLISIVIIKKSFNSSYEKFCEFWRKKSNQNKEFTF